MERGAGGWWLELSGWTLVLGVPPSRQNDRILLLPTQPPPCQSRLSPSEAHLRPPSAPSPVLPILRWPLPCSMHCKHEKNQSKGKNQNGKQNKDTPIPLPGEKKLSFFHRKQDLAFFFSLLIPFPISLLKMGRFGLSLVGSVRHQNKKLNEKYLVRIR